MYLDLRPNIHTPRRLIKDQDSWFGCQPFRDDHLLLIASRKGLCELFDAGGVDLQTLEILGGDGTLAPQINESQPTRDRADNRERYIGRDGKLTHQPMLVAILRNVGDAVAHGLRGRGEAG